MHVLGTIVAFILLAMFILYRIEAARVKRRAKALRTQAALEGRHLRRGDAKLAARHQMGEEAAARPKVKVKWK